VLRGFFFGGFLGAIVSGAGAAALSVMSGPVGLPPSPPKDTLAPSLGDAPAIVPQSPDAVDTALEDTSSVAKPETGDIGTVLEAPETGSENSGVSTTAQDAVLPNPQAMAPAAPSVDASAEINTTPATPPASIDTDDAAPSDGVQTDLPAAPVSPDVSEPAVPSETAEVDLETAPDPDATPTENGSVEADDQVAVEQENEEAAPSEDVAQDAPELPSEPEDLPTEDPAEDTPEEAAPQTRFALSSEGEGLTNRAPEVKTNRLPSIGGTQPQETAQSAGGNALRDNAQPFENPEKKPLLSIILIDNGSTGIGPEALASFPYPLTFALDAASAEAGEKAKTYTEAGFEVVMLTNLPRGATPADVEVALEAYKLAVPQAVALLDLGENGFSGSAELVAQTTENLASTGHGLLTPPKGLNSVGRIADKAGVPNDAIFRDLDGDGQDATVVRRFLDNAAFKAAQLGGVTLLGRLKPDTVSALVLWGGLQRAERVALVPVSAVLLNED